MASPKLINKDSVDTNNNKSNNDDNVKEKNLKNRQNEYCSKISDYKLTIISNSILIGIISYLLIYKTNSIKSFQEYSDCSDYFREGIRQDGIYEIKPTKDSNLRINVYCNMTAGGLTMLFRKQKNSAINFQNSYQVYKNGFGDLNSDHFIGLENMYLLTRDKDRELTAVLNNTNYRFGRFKIMSEFYHYKFVIDNELDKYIDGSSLLKLNNSLFSTYDLDYDLAQNSNCSSGWKAGWWFTDCFDQSLCLTCLIMHGSQGVKNLDYAAMLIK